MIKNSLMKFIDSCVGNIARKIEDEFRESDHPRDKGGKFTSKGGEGRGGGKEEKSSSGNPMNISVSADGNTEGLEAQAEKYGVKAELGENSHGETPVKLSGSKEDIRRYLEEIFYGSEEEAREFSPEAYEESEESEEEDDRDEDTVRKNLNAQLSLYNNHPDWLTEEDMSSIKKDMHKLGMDEEVELMSDKKALKNFQKQAQAAADNLDDNEIEELLESVGVASHRIRQGDVYKMVKQHIKDDPIRMHAAMRKQGLLKFLK